MSVETLLKESLKLKPADQLRMVESIMDHLASSDKEIDRLWNEEANRRLKLYEYGASKAISAEDLLKSAL